MILTNYIKVICWNLLFGGSNILRLRKYPWVNLYLLLGFISNAGNKVYLIATPLLVYELTGSSIQMGAMYFFETLPALIFSVFIGTLADKFNKKYLMIFSNFMQIILLVTISLLSLENLLSLWMLYIVGFLLASFGLLFGIANETILPEIVKEEDLIHVNSIYQTLDTASWLLGPSIGGLIIAFMNPAIALLVDAVTFIPIIVILFFLKTKHTPSKKKDTKTPSFLLETLDGFRYVINNPILLSIMLLSFTVNIANGSVESMFMFLAKDELELDSSLIGIIFSISAISQIIGGLIVPYLIRKFRYERILINSQTLSGLGIIIMSLFSPWIILGIGKSLMEAPTVTYNVVNRTLRQTIVPSKLLGRVNGINRMIALTSIPLSGLIAGILTDWVGVKVVIGGAGILLIIISLLAWFTPLRKTSSYLTKRNIQFGKDTKNEIG